MRAFEWTYPSKLVFGKGRFSQFVPFLKDSDPKKVLLHYGGSSIIRTGVLGKIKDELNEAGIAWCELGGVKPNPRISMVREGIDLCKREQVDFILACGGGSVIDSSKAIAAGVCADEDIWDVIAGFKPITRAIPIGVILTIPATASETGSAFVISNEATRQKLLTASPAVVPKFAVIDPELYLSIPPKAYWPGVCDMISHVLERYFTNEEHTELTDGICEAVMRNVIRNGNRLLNGENTVEVWSELALSANMAHNSICSWGRMPDWSCHMIEHELSAQYDVTHGAGLTVLTPAWMKYVYKKHIPFFAQFAVNVMGAEPNLRSQESLAKWGIEQLEQLYRSWGMPTKLSELGICDEEHFEHMAKEAVGFSYDSEARLGSLEPLSWEDVVNILKLAV